MSPKLRLQMVLRLNFDLSKIMGRNVVLGCSCCSPIAINGMPTHERGCSNALRECKGCNAMIPTCMEYCDDCS